MVGNRVIRNINELTPIDNFGGMYFKRDDLFMPYEDIPISGDKVRQCISLFEKNEDYIKNWCDNQVALATFISSPQGIIVSRVAKEFGFNAKIFVGGTSIEGLRKNILTNNMLRQGCIVDCLAKSGYRSVVDSRLRDDMKSGSKFFNASFEYDTDNRVEELMDSVGYQVQNIPDNLDYLFVACGRSITLSGVIRGIVKYKKEVGKVIGIQVAGHNNLESIEKYIEQCDINYGLEVIHGMDYHKKLSMKIGSIVFDPIYESKAFSYIINNLGTMIHRKKCLFWVCGNSTFVRNNLY